MRLRCRQHGEGGYRKEKENPFVIPLESLRILGNPFGTHKNAWGMSRNSLRILRKERRVRARGGRISENPKVPNLSASLCKTYTFGMVFICSCRVAHGPRFPWIVNYRDKKVRGGGGGEGEREREREEKTERKRNRRYRQRDRERERG